MDIRSFLFCVAVICCQLLITGITAGTSTNLNETPPNSFEGRSTISGLDSGRSLVLKSVLLLPLGIGLVILALMALIPIPVIVSGGRVTVGGRTYENASRAMDLAKSVMTSEECVEKISCELSNIAKSYEATSWIPRRIEAFVKHSPYWADKVSRGFHTTNSCQEFNCHPMKTMKKYE